ncbi:LOW QUALITY PROTEIN: ral guanine nucleotide dissociation stimulator-like 1 [Clupea harengus]|uniref:LOW QUALITY PROTEIN: ral guanine nucleotide dissociation stimulator-like 1 n=1 Tax=Clupea harengus TaxID=7950 RepID=A0A6P8F693_CLUHA|nr:LOW QUALITY PROTEIN: ral guanine nucleotide dissociation stimulator-like 1 [Clupea harengus]
MVVSGGEKGPRSRVGPMRWLLCLGGQHMEDPVDANPGVWLQSFQLLDMEHNDQDPVQEWADELEEDIVYGVTLRREPVQSPTEPDEAQPVSSFIQYRTHKVRRVKAATLDRLVGQLLDTECQDPDYGRIFLSTYRAFTTPNTLIEQLFQRDDMVVNLDNGVCLRREVQGMTFHPLVCFSPNSPLLPLISMWLEDYKEDLREPPQHQALRVLCVHLTHRVCFRRLAGQAKALLRKFQDEDNHTSAAASAPEPCVAAQEEEEESGELTGELGSNLKDPEIPHQFMDFTEQDIAEQLTQLDAELFVKVVPFHCVGCVWSQRDKKENRDIAPTVRATIAQFNAVTNRVITSLLCYPTEPVSSSGPAQRAKVIEKWITVAKECRQLRNFSSLRAILSALQSNAVYRLKKTWTAVSRESLEAFDQLCETFPDENCVLTSREILVEVDSPSAEGNPAPKSPKLCPLSRQLGTNRGIIPYLGTYLTVLTMLDTALTDTVEGGLINFEKRRREFEIVAQIRQLQASCSNYRLKPHPHISSWLAEGSLLTDQQSYELSQELEPPVDPCPNSPSWSHRLISKKITSLLTNSESSGRKTHADQISVSSSGSSGSEMEDMSSPSASPLRLKLQSLSNSCQNVAEDFSSCSSTSPTPSSSSNSSSQTDLTPLSPDSSSSSISSSSSSSSFSPPPCARLPVYNKQVADSCIVRVNVEFGNNGNVYKSILLTSQDKTPQVVQKALEKHNLEGMDCHAFSLSQVLSQDKELLFPDKANVFYAMCTSANYDFVLRQRWRNHGRTLGSSSRSLGSSSSPCPVARVRHGK